MECNQMKAREALKPWIAFAEWLLENAGKDKLGEAIRENGPIIRQRMEELRAALSEPPRNCDVGTAEEQSDRYDVQCRMHTGCSDCPLYKGEGDGGPRHCEFAWAQMPYEEGGRRWQVTCR